MRRIITAILIMAGVVASSNASTSVCPAQGATNVDPAAVVLRWDLHPQVSTNTFRIKVYLGPVALGCDKYLVLYTMADTNSLAVQAVLEPNTLYEWQIDDCDDINGAVLDCDPWWEWDGDGHDRKTTFTTGSGDLRRAHTPIPANGSTVTSAVDNALQWSAGSGAATKVTYNVYFGKDSTPDETEFRGNFTNRSFAAGILVPDTTYYWRIDTVDTDRTTVITNSVWRFKTGINPVNYTGTNTILYADEFENGTLNECPLTWTRQGDSQLRTVLGQGKVVKLSGSSSIERKINTWGMENIQISYRCSLAGYTNYGGYLRCQISTNGGAGWINLRSSQTGSFSNNPSVVTCSTNAGNQFDLRVRFLSDSTNTAACTYLDCVKISGVYAPVLPAHDTSYTSIEDSTAIFLGDSLTANNDGAIDHWTGMLTNLFNIHLLSAYSECTVKVTNTETHAVTTNYVPVRVATHGKGGSRAFQGIGYRNKSPYTGTNIIHGSEAAAWDGGGYQRLEYAFDEAAAHTNGMVIPDFVLINFGMNDHKRDKKSGLEMSTPYAFTNHLKMIVDQVRINGSRPILVVPHDFYPGETNSFEAYNHDYSPAWFTNVCDNGSALGRFHLFLDAMRKLAHDMNVDLIDINKTAYEYDQNEFTVNGGVHLSDLGHAVYTQIIGDYLNAKYGDGN